jgi:hypothetical protein
MSFQDFYKNMGFVDYPFAIFTSESEQDRQKELFYDTSLYSPIVQNFLSGNTIILSGDRGTGKTAILYDLVRRLQNSKTLVVEISDYSSLKWPFDPKQLYIFLTQQLADALFSIIANSKFNYKLLTKNERISLSYFFARYTKHITKAALKSRLEELQMGPLSRLGAFIYKATRQILNIGANGLVHFLGDLVARSAGASSTDVKWNEYFPELASSIESDFADADGSLTAFCRLVDLCKKLRYEKVLLILDKIDEDPRFGNAAEDIAEFIEPLLTDNKLLLNNKFQLVVSLWIIPLNMLKGSVRTQKLNCPIINWSFEDLKAALNRRLSVFSNGNVTNVETLLEDSLENEGLEKILSLSNRNPRDLWHVMNRIMLAQHRIDQSSNRICSQAIQEGLDSYVREFNFYEYYPRKSNAKKNSMDIYAYINHLLKLDGAEFTKNKLNEKAGTGSSTPNYVSAMENMGLVEASGSASGSATYTIRDPKVVYAIKNKIDISRST